MREHCGTDYVDDDYDMEDTFFYDDEDEEEDRGEIDEPGVNATLLLEELRYVTIFPEAHDQSMYVLVDQEKQPAADDFACGTFGCLAGNAVIHQEIPLSWVRIQRPNYDGDEITYRTQWKADRILDENGEEGERIHEKARQLFNMNQTQADLLFDGSNNLDHLWDYAEQVTSGAITQEDYAQAQHDHNMRRIMRDGGAA